MALLEMRGIEKRFGGVEALKGVDFTLEAREVHALVGENGAGKSTLMKVLSGALTPDSDAILLEGRPLRLHSVAEAQRQGIVMVYQELNLVPDLTVAENLALGRLPPLVSHQRLHPRGGRCSRRWACGSRRNGPCDRSAPESSNWSRWPGHSRCGQR